jgi:hypothetical protein
VLEKDGNSLADRVTNEEVLHKVKNERNIPHLIKEKGKLPGLVTYCVEAVL